MRRRINSSGGSTEFYAVYRAQLSPDKIFGLNTKFGPFTAINFEIGGDLESENTAIRAKQEAARGRSELQIGLAAGFLNIGVHMSKEWNHNGICDDAVRHRRRAGQLPCHPRIRIRLAV